MTMVVLLALGLGSGMAWPAAVAVGSVIGLPGIFVPIAGWWAVRGRLAARAGSNETEILAGIAGELRAGRSLRHALAGPGGSDPGHPLRRAGRLAASGAPIGTLTPSLREALPGSGDLVVPAIGMLESSGGNAAAVFEMLAASHALEESLAAERRAALAPARISAAVLLGLPAIAMTWLVASGRIADLMADPVGRLLAALGIAFIAAGSGTFVFMLRRGFER